MEESILLNISHENITLQPSDISDTEDEPEFIDTFSGVVNFIPAGLPPRSSVKLLPRTRSASGGKVIGRGVHIYISVVEKKI